MRALRSVLVIDDNPDTLETFSVLLHSLGVEHVTPVASAEDATDALKNQQYSLILADYQLEGMTGVQFLEGLRADGDMTPVIMISGAMDKKGLSRVRRQPRVDFFPKPFRLADLMMVMDRMAA